MTLVQLKNDLDILRNPVQASLLRRFFKTGKGEYGEGDVFLGIKVPEQRKVALRYKDLPFSDIEKLLNSKVHEHRLVALLILVHRFEKGNDTTRKYILEFYLRNAAWVNNWDLVDLSAPRIVGMYLLDRKGDRKILYALAKSKQLWERRIAILSTLAFIVEKRESKDAFRITQMLLGDKHDLIHKACGWMLREVGKRCGERVLEAFLKKNAGKMPRTMLRYAIEKFSQKKRAHYMRV